MARIGGDDRDSPHGWSVDVDNWGIRPVRAEDHGRRMANHDAQVASFFENDRLYVMRADVAEYFDGKD